MSLMFHGNMKGCDECGSMFEGDGPCFECFDHVIEFSESKVQHKKYVLTGIEEGTVDLYTSTTVLGEGEKTDFECRCGEEFDSKEEAFRHLREEGSVFEESATWVICDECNEPVAKLAGDAVRLNFDCPTCGTDLDISNTRTSSRKPSQNYPSYREKDGDAS